MVALVSRLALLLLFSGLQVRSVRAEPGRRYTPEGFQFPLSTSSFIYHLPTKGLGARIILGTWIAETVEGVKADQVIDQAEIRPGELPAVYFSLGRGKNPWPPGLYRLEIRADGRLLRTERFVLR
ncbi:WavE lipopolysaccharide synthesis family protein [Synechococcus sp. GFB01]|uniref:WavE lipopolysaccharide synthesis family protein n=1 Tax=Synechococcus sp. GFB01 TaxID=1662190 RepID=UPI00064E5723|nr:WavE lipopolysaccharide synthesis family protein [Synechococcus sp. GFB01]KMM17363.1 hypothetical protein SYNGFB01_04550 [Synechococcus sp. GFB01]